MGRLYCPGNRFAGKQLDRTDGTDIYVLYIAHIGKKRRNWGVLNNKVVTFDIGRWYHDDKLQTPAGYKKEMIKGTKIFRKYLLDNEPEKLGFVNNKLENYFKIFNENYQSAHKKLNEKKLYNTYK